MLNNASVRRTSASKVPVFLQKWWSPRTGLTVVGIRYVSAPRRRGRDGTEDVRQHEADFRWGTSNENTNARSFVNINIIVLQRYMWDEEASTRYINI